MLRIKFRSATTLITRCDRVQECVEREAACVFSFSSLARHSERGSGSYYKHKEVQQHLHVQWGDHVTDALCRIHRGKSRCLSGRMHVFNGASRRCCESVALSAVILASNNIVTMGAAGATVQVFVSTSPGGQWGSSGLPG